jgi:uncharacterized membrane protein
MLHGAMMNLLLAVIPVVLGYALATLLGRRFAQPAVKLLVCLPLAVAWLVFLPNACYLLTEWRHLLFDPTWAGLLDAGRWDRIAMLRTAKWALLFLGYSGVGVLLFVLAIRPMERWWRGLGRHPMAAAPFLFFLTSLGVYLGLIVRLNSWDLVRKPRHVWLSAIEALTNSTLLLSIVVFALLLWALYEAVDIWVDGASERLQRWGVLRGGGGSGGGRSGGGGGGRPKGKARR